jgi:cell division protein FtsQ
LSPLPPRPPAGKSSGRPAPRPVPPGSAAPAKPAAVKASKAPKNTDAKPARATQVARPAKASRVSNSIRAERKAAKASVRNQLNELRSFTKGSPLRRGIIYTSLGSVLVLIALVLATIFTPMMAIDKIEIVGLHRLKQATVYNAVKSLEGTPLTLVDEGQIQKRLAGFTLIQSFTTVSLPPHTLQLFIQERQPIGIVSIGATDYLYDPAGVQIGPTGNSNNYPMILVNGDPAKSANYREAVQVLLALPTSLYPNVASIQATSVDDVRIHLRGIANKQILWGDSSQSLLKSRVLTALMANVKKNTSVVLDVSSPTAPTVRYGNF